MKSLKTFSDTDNDDEYPENYFTATDKFVTICGQSNLSPKTHRVVRILYSLYNRLLYTLASTFLILELIAFTNFFGDNQMIVRQISMIITHLLGLIKLLVLTNCQGRMDKIKSKLQNKMFYYKSSGNFKPGFSIQEGKKASGIICTFLFCLYSFVGVSAHITAVLLVKNNTDGQHFVNNATCQSFLPYYYYYPFDVTTKNRCYYSLMFMDVCLVIFAFYIATLDAIFVAILHLWRAQLNILLDALVTMRKRCLKNLGLGENFTVLNDLDYPPLEEEMYRELTHCTKHVMSLLDVRNDIEDLFTFVTLGQTLSSLFIFASCLFGAVKEPKTSPNFFSQMQYFFAVLCQFSVYCWFGDQLTIKSQSIPLALYKTDWYGCSLRFKKSMLLTMVRMQKPVYLSIGKFSPLTLTTLLAVIKGSFSYFTVFQTVEN